MTDQRSQFDIAFVGGGLSSTWSLIQLVQNLPSKRVTPALRLLLLEKSTDTYKGIAYGERSGDTALIINSLGDFLPPDELKRFTEWVVKNIDWLFDRFKASGGARTTEWLRKHAAEIEAGELSMLYIPRYLFGLYLENLASICLDTATANGLVEYEAIQAEVIDLVPGSDNYRIHAESCDMSHHEYLASKVILGLGSPPGKKVVTKADLEHQSDPVIGNPFEPSMRATLESVHSRLEQTCRESNRVLIVGSNASAVDMVCNLADYKNVIELIDTVVLMSPSGELPDRISESEIGTVEYHARHLSALVEAPSVKSSDIYTAAEKDLNESRSRSIPSSISFPAVSAAFGKLLNNLPMAEKKIFVTETGNAIGRMMRRAGDDYSDVLDQLSAQNKLELLKGEYLSYEIDDEKNASVAYRNQDNATKTLDNIIAIIDCTGGGSLRASTKDRLIGNLIERDLCNVNDSGLGFTVTKDLETRCKGLFVIGPMLAGNLVGEKPIWHVEHCGRIMELASQLSAKLLSETYESHPHN